VRRLVAFALVQALILWTAMASSLHVHEYAGHDHPEHHHGPASHEHHHSAAADDHHLEDDDSDHPCLQAESCDPGRHAVAVTMGCAQVPTVHVEIAELPGPAILAPTSSIRAAIPLTDVRVHGPPFDVAIPSRAPPLTHLA
jgi:hypothetical protein